MTFCAENLQVQGADLQILRARCRCGARTCKVLRASCRCRGRTGKPAAENAGAGRGVANHAENCRCTPPDRRRGPRDLQVHPPHLQSGVGEHRSPSRGVYSPRGSGPSGTHGRLLATGTSGHAGTHEHPERPRVCWSSAAGPPCSLRLDRVPPSLYTLSQLTLFSGSRARTSLAAAAGPCCQRHEGCQRRAERE